MTRTIIVAAALSLGFSAASQAYENLEVVFDGCEPLRVLSNDDSCGEGGDPVDVACRPDNGPVRWVPLSKIREINTKEGSPGALHNCQPMEQQGYYQCIVRGNVGDEVSYFVTSTEGCTLDPVIRVR